MLADMMKQTVRRALVETGAWDRLEKSGLKAPLKRVYRALGDADFRKGEVNVIKDLVAFRSNVAPIAEQSGRVRTGKIALLVCLSDGINVTKINATLLKSLQFAGYHPVVLSARGHWSNLYYAAAGLMDRIHLEDVLERIPEHEATAEAEALWRELDGKDLLPATYRGALIGRSLLSSILHDLQMGMILPDSQEISQRFHRALPNTVRMVRGYERLLDELHPDILLFNERGYSGYGEIFDLAVKRGLDCINWAHTQRADAISLMRYDTSNTESYVFSVSDSSWKTLQGLEWTEKQEKQLDRELRERYERNTWFSDLQAGKRIKSPDEVRKQLGLDPAKKTAVIFSHVLWDGTFFDGTNLFKDYEQWLVECVKVACRNTRVNWIVKLHPDYINKIKSMGEAGRPRDLEAIHSVVGELPPHIKVMQPDTDISTFALFPVTDYCLTVRGTIGMEMACYGISVFTAGSGRYDHMGFTVDFDSAEELLERLAHIEDTPRLTKEQTLLAKRHAHGLLVLRPCPLTTLSSADISKSALGSEIQLTVSSKEAFVGAPDIQKFVRWATDPEKPTDFLSFPD